MKFRRQYRRRLHTGAVIQKRATLFFNNLGYWALKIRLLSPSGCGLALNLTITVFHLLGLVLLLVATAHSQALMVFVVLALDHEVCNVRYVFFFFELSRIAEYNGWQRMNDTDKLKHSSALPCVFIDAVYPIDWPILTLLPDKLTLIRILGIDRLYSFGEWSIRTKYATSSS